VTGALAGLDQGKNMRGLSLAPAYLSLKLTPADQDPYCGGLSAMPAVGDLFPSDHVTLKLSSPEGDLEAPRKGRKTRMVDGTKNRSAEQWTNADLFFLTDAVACGMPFAEVAGFLNRTESEVRARWKLD
jgi:hypothetical protein